VTPGFHSWPTPSQALALVASPRLSCDNSSRVATNAPIFKPLGQSIVKAPPQHNLDVMVHKLCCSHQ